MQHLSLPSQSTGAKIRVPCLIVPTYSAVPVATYLQRVNWTEEHFYSPKDQDVAPDLAMARLQKLLFFGTLGELATAPGVAHTLQSYAPGEFSCANGEGSRLISTEHLLSFCSRAQLELGNASYYEQDHYRNNMIRVIQQSNVLISKVNQSGLGPAHQAVVLSIMALNESLAEAFDLGELEAGRPHFRSLLLESLMRSDGWCPSDIERLRLDLDIDALHFIAHCGAPACPKTHEDCGRQICHARQVLDDEIYRPKHVLAGSCDCRHVPVDLDVVFKSLNRDIIPVTAYDYDSRPALVKALPSDEVSHYVAISHVWSDHMGNVSANALPRCLLKHLQARVDNLYESIDGHVPFWIDTLCCPVEPDTATDQAIALMRETYSDADKVLVLDSYLEAVDSRNMTDFELALRIIASGWIRRLWTLQEGVLAKEIYFQFADAAINGDDLFMRLAEPPISYKTTALFHCWLEIRLNWNGKLDPSILSSESIWMLYRALRFRTTSVSTDEALCLSTLAGVDLKKILETGKEDRMRRFWELLPSISTVLLYWDGPRLDVPGFRWAPASLLGASPEAFVAHSVKQISGAKEAIRTPSGIVLTSPGILLGQWTTSVRKGFWLRCDPDSWYYVDLVGEIGQPRSFAGEGGMVGTLQDWDRISDPPQVLALLTHGSFEELFDDTSFQLAGHPPSCAIVSIYGANQDPEYLTASFVGTGAIRPLPPSQIHPTSGFSVPALAKVAERELRARMDGSEETAHAWDGMSEEEKQLRSYRARVMPAAKKSSLIIDDPDIKASLKDDRLSLVISENHTMFHGKALPHTTCFCLG